MCIMDHCEHKTVRPIQGLHKQTFLRAQISPFIYKWHRLQTIRRRIYRHNIRYRWKMADPLFIYFIFSKCGWTNFFRRLEDVFDWRFSIIRNCTGRLSSMEVSLFCPPMRSTRKTLFGNIKVRTNTPHTFIVSALTMSYFPLVCSAQQSIACRTCAPMLPMCVQ